MTSQQARILAVGDSFIGIFSLFKKDANIDIHKFKGATAKGLLKPLNENRIQLLELTTIPANKYRCCIFNFGQVDVHHSFYYNLVGRKQVYDINEFFENLARDYVGFVATLDIPLKIILAVYPSPLDTAQVPRELMTYNVLGPDDVVSYPLEEWWRIASREARHSRLMAFNNSLEEACKEHEGTVYMSLNDQVLNPDNSVKQEFKDINPVNLHLLWEPLIVLWADKLGPLDIGLQRSALVDMQRSASAYNTRKIAEVGDQVFSVGPRLKLIMDYLDGQAVESNEKLATPLQVETHAADIVGVLDVAPPVSSIVAPQPSKVVESDKEKSVGAWRRSGDTSEGSRGHGRSNSGSASGSGSGSRSRSDSYSLEYRSNGSSRITSSDNTVPGSPNEYGRRTSGDSRQRDDRTGNTSRKTYADSYNLNAASSGSNSNGGSGGRNQGGSGAYPQSSLREGIRSEGQGTSAGRSDGPSTAHRIADSGSDSLDEVPYLKRQSQQYQYQYRAPPPLVTDGDRDANDDSHRDRSNESSRGHGRDSRQGRNREGEGENDKHRLHHKQSRGQNEDRPKEIRQPPPPPQQLRDPDRDRDRDRSNLTSPRQQTLSDRFQSLSSPRQHVEDDYEDERNPPQRLRQPFEGRQPQGDRNNTNPQRREKERNNRR